MNILKKILYSLLGIILLALAVALFIPKEFRVVREITISKPKQVVFDYVKLLKNQNDFSVWASMDPNMKKEFRGTDGTVGFVSAWDSKVKDVGKGEQEIIGIIDGDRIDYELRFMLPMKSKDYAYMSTEALTNTTTRVKWGFAGRMSYPANLMLLFMNMDAMLGKDLEQGLNKLRTILEQS
jgi:hypothetical protein